MASDTCCWGPSLQQRHTLRTLHRLPPSCASPPEDHKLGNCTGSSSSSLDTQVCITRWRMIPAFWTPGSVFSTDLHHELLCQPMGIWVSVLFPACWHLTPAPEDRPTARSPAWPQRVPTSLRQIWNGKAGTGRDPATAPWYSVLGQPEHTRADMLKTNSYSFLRRLRILLQTNEL